MPAYVAESRVLKAKDPTIKDHNNWEIFTLSTAEVRNPKSGELCSLLDAHAFTPVIVTGRLQPVKPEQRSLLLRPDANSKSTPIQIDNVCEFSYGTNETGQILIWAAGNAGWFELRGGRAYKEIYQQIEEAVRLQFFLEDVYRQSRSKAGAGPSADMVFRELAGDERFDCGNQRAAGALVARHRNFLLTQMFKRNTDVNWSRTPLYSYLKTKYSSDFQNMKNKHDGKSPSPPSKAANRRRSSSDGNSTSEGHSSDRNATQSKPKISQAPKKDDAYWKAKVVWELMQRADTQGHVAASTMTISEVANVLYHRYEIETDLAASFVRALSPIIRFMMEQKTARKKNGIQWTKTPIYKELGSTSPRLTAARLRQLGDVQLKSRKDPIPMEISTPEASEESPPPEPADRETRLRRRSHKGKSSVLRPKSTRFSGKGKGPARVVQSPKGPARQSVDDVSDTESVQTPSKRKANFGELPPNKRRSSRLASASSNSSQTLTATEPEQEETSTSEESTDPYDEEEDTSEEEDDEEEEEEDDEDITIQPPITSSALPLHLRPVKGVATNSPSGSKSLSQGVTSSPLSSYEANQPGDVWLCTFDGCTRRIYGASEEEGRELVREHIAEHEEEELMQQRKLALVVREGELGGRLPVSNLIQRIREMSDAQQNILAPTGALQAVEAAVAAAFPKPIAQRY